VYAGSYGNIRSKRTVVRLFFFCDCSVYSRNQSHRFTTFTSRFINPFTDYGFKRLFGTEANKDLLIDFLNQLLPQKHQIVDLQYARNEYIGVNELDRKAVFDLYCVNQNGDRFIVELQKAKQVYFKDRSIFYSSFPIQEQGQVGNWNFKLTSVYTVAILDFVLTDNADVINTLLLKDQHNEVFYDKLTYIYMEMPKFTKTEEQLETRSDKWLYLFKHLSELQEPPEQLKERIFHKLFNAAEVANFDRVERDRYEQSLRAYRDLENVLSSAHLEGIQTGIEQGSNQATLRIIQNALAKGFSIAEIADLVGLPQEEIKTINQ
jgi:predicted transposase/invertase (TIGR01784 family)